MTRVTAQRQRDSIGFMEIGLPEMETNKLAFARLLSRPTKCLTLLDRHMKEVTLRSKWNNVNFFAESFS
jgi:hypothetical protein